MSKAIHARFVEISKDLSPVLAEAIARTKPIELVPNQNDPFSERLCRAIAGQQLSVKAARSIWGRVVDSAADRSLVEYFAEVDPTTLRTCGLSAAKAKSMRAIALATRSGQLDAEELGALDQSDRSQRLTAIWGVGQWTADMMGIFYFGDPNIWPDGDTTARKMLERLTSPRRKTTRTATRFAPHRSYLALYMWHQADAAPT
ncbi:MAG: DNA-3-methyladenine glycosylase 2 family protein [Cyanobacteria bacterium P01_A01_bin.123]